jgi:hypothetical protein
MEWMPLRQVSWGPEEWATADRLWQRMHAVATIMAAAIEAATPLLTSRNLQVAPSPNPPTLTLSNTGVMNLSRVKMSEEVVMTLSEPYTALPSGFWCLMKAGASVCGTLKGTQSLKLDSVLFNPRSDPSDEVCSPLHPLLNAIYFCPQAFTAAQL